MAALGTSSGNSPRRSRAALYAMIARIRAFEQELLRLFSQGKLSGTTHTCIGQEACAAALYAHLDETRDMAFSNHRCHGHYLAYGGPMSALLAEIMGKTGGTCGGRGGSQHLCYRGFFSQGIQGGSVPIAVGCAYQLKRAGQGGLVVVHLGDGTLGEGVVYESMNLLSLLDLPVLVVLEHNGWAQSTDTSRTTAGNVLDRFRAFGLSCDRRAADDVVSLAAHLGDVVEHVRAGHPFVQILDTVRLMPHSKGDDDRDPALLTQLWERDEFQRCLTQSDPDAVSGWTQAEQEVRAVVEEVEAAPWAPLDQLTALATPAPSLFVDSNELLPSAERGDDQKRINELLNEGITHCLASDPQAIFLGEDVLDPYGGAFKVARGLSTKYPDRVISTPISEAAIVGFGNGAALCGGKPMVEIMFGDFVALAADQLINQAAKAHFMYGGQVHMPTTVRLVSGGYRGYGPTHSQSLEGLFCGVAGLKVVALSRRHRPQAILERAVLRDPNPVLFVENKLLYALRPSIEPPRHFDWQCSRPVNEGHYPSLLYRTSDRQSGDVPDVTVVTYGGLTDLVEEALTILVEQEELEIDYVILTQLSPLHVEEIAASVAASRCLVIVEEGPVAFGVGSEIVAAIRDALPDLEFRSRRVGAAAIPIPSARHQERMALPATDDVVRAVLEVV